MNTLETTSFQCGQVRQSIADVAASVERVGIWALALKTFAKPIPEYAPAVTGYAAENAARMAR